MRVSIPTAGSEQHTHVQGGNCYSHHTSHCLDTEQVIINIVYTRKYTELGYDYNVHCVHKKDTYSAQCTQEGHRNKINLYIVKRNNTKQGYYVQCVHCVHERKDTVKIILYIVYKSLDTEQNYQVYIMYTRPVDTEQGYYVHCVQESKYRTKLTSTLCIQDQTQNKVIMYIVYTRTQNKVILY